MSLLDRMRSHLPDLTSRLDLAKLAGVDISKYPRLDVARYSDGRKRLLKAIAGLVLVYGLNKTLNRFAYNHWRLRRQGMPWDFPTETAIVTGGCSGFGLRTVKGLADKLKRVIVLDVSPLPEDLQRIPNVSYYRCDITDPQAVEAVAGEIRKAFGSITILINNAGIAQAHTIQDTSPAYLQKIFQVNVFSHWYLIQQFLPDMLEKKKGHILALASMASYSGVGSLVDYCATKHAVLALHNGLEQELKYRYTNGRCIDISIVHPMWARTPLVDSWNTVLVREKAPVLEPSQVADVVVKRILSGKSGQEYIPGKFSLVSGMHGFPRWLHEIINDGSSIMTNI